MSTLKMQESTPDDEVSQLRKEATHKDNNYATLENELLKKNNELAAMKATLNDALYKLRNEADRALKLELDLNRRSEDLRAEQLGRQNLEASMKVANDKLNSEKLASKHLQMELENYASRTTSQHELELKHLRQEKTTLEARVRALEAQSHAQVNRPSQPPTRLPRPTTFSGATSTAADARIATLETQLSRAEQELADAASQLAAAQQEAVKVPRLQSDLIAAENARMRAERAASTEKAEVRNTQDLLKEREEELEYWRSTAGERSVIECKLEDMTRERDEAVWHGEEMRRCEAALRSKLGDMEEREIGLVMEKEEALEALHRLQAESHSGSQPSNDTLANLQATLAERDTALANVRDYAAELQQMYRDTLHACEEAETRVRALEDAKVEPLIIVSPPSSPASRPFLPQTTMSPADEAIVARLLAAIERLRGERDALRRDLHFAHIEHRVAKDALQTHLSSTKHELHRLQESLAAGMGDASVKDGEVCRLTADLERSKHAIQAISEELMGRNAEQKVFDVKTEALRKKLREAHHGEEQQQARNVVAALIVVQQLSSQLEEADASIYALIQTCDQLAQAHHEAQVFCEPIEVVRDAKMDARDAHLSDALRSLHERDAQLTQTREELVAARSDANIQLSEAIQARDTSVAVQDTLRTLDASSTRLSVALQASEERAIEITDMRCQLSDLQTKYSSVQCELTDARAELSAAEARYAEQQLSALSSADGGAAAALKSQLEVLEQRVLRRTEQIGMQQHDIKRLETNLRVAEDTIGELTGEVETLGLERECLLEDCGQAREARDDAHRRVEALEVEIEMLVREQDELREVKEALQTTRAENQASGDRIEVMVHLLMESVARSRALSSELALNVPRLAAVEADFHTTEANLAHARANVEHLTSELDLTAMELREKTTVVETVTRELAQAKDETRRLSVTLESFRDEVQSREEDLSGQTDQLTATIEELEGQLMATQKSEETLSRELEAARHGEAELRVQLQLVQEESGAVAAEAQKLSSTIASLEVALEMAKSSHSKTLAEAHQVHERRTTEFEAQLAEARRQHAALETTHAEVVQGFTVKTEGLEARLAGTCTETTVRESLEAELDRMKAEHADETSALRSQLDEAASQVDTLQAQLQTATDAITEYESEIEAFSQQYDAAQVEIRGLEHALAGTRAQLDEHDASVQALQREKIVLQAEHTQMEAELERATTKYQYVEQQAKRSDHDVARLRSEMEHLRAEATKFDEAAQAAEVSLSFKTVQFEQKVAMMQRELKKQQEHRHCQESIAEFREKNEYLEEMLRMKAVEIEENDDRFIEALKEKKRLNGKLDNLTRKVQNLQAKLATATSASNGPSPTTPATLPPSRPKTPSPPVLPPMPSAGPSTRPPTRIPSSPAAALRAKTPEPSRRPFAHRFATPEPPVPLPARTFAVGTPDPAPARVSRADLNMAPSTSCMIPSAAPSTPTSYSSRKRRAPDDFDSPAPLPAQAVIAASGNLTPLRHVRRPTNESRSGFTPTRNGNVAPTRPSVPQQSPLRRVTAPLVLAESTNSPRSGRTLGLGKPSAVSKPPMRSWLSKARAPTVGGGLDTRSSGTFGLRS